MSDHYRPRRESYNSTRPAGGRAPDYYSSNVNAAQSEDDYYFDDKHVQNEDDDDVDGYGHPRQEEQYNDYHHGGDNYYGNDNNAGQYGATEYEEEAGDYRYNNGMDAGLQQQQQYGEWGQGSDIGYYGEDHEREQFNDEEQYGGLGNNHRLQQENNNGFHSSFEEEEDEFDPPPTVDELTRSRNSRGTSSTHTPYTDHYAQLDSAGMMYVQQLPLNDEWTRSLSSGLLAPGADDSPGNKRQEWLQNQTDNESLHHSTGNMVDILSKNANESKKSTTKKKRLLVYAFSILFLGGIGAMTWWLATRGGHGNVSKRSTDDESSPTLSPSTRGDDRSSIPAVPENIETLCGRDQFADSQFGVLSCEIACGPAKCCWYEEGDERSCRKPEDGDAGDDSDDDPCLSYSPSCQVLFGQQPPDHSDAFIPAAPTDLRETCRLDRIAGRAAAMTSCLELCYDGYCCFSSAINIVLDELNATIGPSCYESQVERCTAYSPCLSLIVGLVHTIMDRRHDNATNVTDPSGAQNETSTQEPRYVLPEPRSDLEDICHPSSLNSQTGMVICTSACARANCCTAIGSTDANCFLDEIQRCNEYAKLCSPLFNRLAGGNDTYLPEEGDNSTWRIPLPPSNLEELCSNTDSGTSLFQCISSCSDALCCRIDPGNGTAPDASESCSVSDADRCALYEQPCSALFVNGTNGDQESLAPPFSQEITDLHRACTGVLLGRNETLQACQDLCNLGACCRLPLNDTTSSNNSSDGGAEFNSIASCANQTHFCADYDICLLVDDIDAILDLNTTNHNSTAAQNISASNTTGQEIGNSTLWESACVGPFSAPDRCIQECQLGFCCFLSEEHPSYCGSQQSYCNTFDPCSVLFDYLLPLEEKAPSDTEDLPAFIVNETVCNASYVDEAGKDDCVRDCEVAACCFLNGTSNECDAEVAFCSQFDHCQILIDLGLQNDNTDSRVAVLNQVCDEALIPMDPWDCIRECNEISCCFDNDFTATDVVEGCPASTDGIATSTESCSEYSICQNLIAIPHLPVDVSRITNSSTISAVEEACDLVNGDRTACQQECSVAICCFMNADDADNCLNESEFCAAFKPCTNGLLTGGNGLNVIHDNRTAVEIACDPDTGIKEVCLSECDEARCCYASEHESCVDETGFCGYFEACGNLKNDTVGGSLLDEPKPYNNTSIEIACDAVNGDKNDCQLLCSEASCCYIEGPDNCEVDQPDVCEEYIPCKTLAENSALVQDTVESLEIQQAVEEACDLANDGNRDDCVAICTEALCCFLDVDNNQSCLGNQPDFCALFDACANLQTTSSGMKALSPKSGKDSENSVLKTTVKAKQLTSENWMEPPHEDAMPPLEYMLDEVTGG